MKICLQKFVHTDWSFSRSHDLDLAPPQQGLVHYKSLVQEILLASAIYFQNISKRRGCSLNKRVEIEIQFTQK